jgi:crotonobetainyl-CoA:carnitine CoA-transferase CaiB-like acyl-CoA transferase
MAALQGIRVLELAGGVGAAYAAKLLADLGADVIRVETDRDIVRSRPFEVHRWLNTNKRSVSSIGDLLDGADLVLHDLTPSVAAAAGLDPAALLEAHPRLVVCALTAYGSTGPWADYAATELNMMHASSWANVSPAAATDVELPPLKAPGHHATIMTATVGATAALAAVDKAARTGVGELVDFSMFAAGARMTETAPAAANFLHADASRLGTRTVVPWGIYACRDGLIQLICVEQAQWESLVHLMGDPEWATMEVFADNAARKENSDLVHLYLSEWMATQDVVDLFLRGQEARICLIPVYTMEQLDRDAHFAERGFFVEDPEGLRLPSRGFRYDQPWWELRRAAPAAGADDGAGWEPRPVEPAPVPATAPAPTRPLEGIKVCDFTWVWAGPYCTQLLAHLGAEVVRIESPEHLCLFRRLPFNPPELPLTPDSNGLFQLYNSDKRSIGIDLRRAEARAVVERMIAASDVVVDNFAVGTLADLGFGLEQIRALNPDAVVVSLTGFGQTGPYADFMAYGPSGGAGAGLYAANGYTGGMAAETGVAIGDPGTGLTGAWATVAALVARRRTGVAARVDVGMVEAIAATVGELWMQYQAEGVPPGPAANSDPQWAPHGVYATGPDQWLTLACTTDAQWAALAALAGADDPAFADARFATVAGRKAAEADLDALVAGWVAGKDRWELTGQLQAVGVAVVPSISPLELWSGNEQLAAIGMLEQPDHPVTGRHTVPGIPWRLSNGPNGLRRPAPMLGQHTAEVLVELGFSPTEIEALLASGAVRTVAGGPA